MCYLLGAPVAKLNALLNAEITFAAKRDPEHQSVTMIPFKSLEKAVQIANTNLEPMQATLLFEDMPLIILNLIIIKFMGLSFASVLAAMFGVMAALHKASTICKYRGTSGLGHDELHRQT
jgi:hypothetical protein